MTTTVEAVYEKGTLTLPGDLPLPEKARVFVTTQTGPESALDSERAAWLKLSEERLVVKSVGMLSPRDQAELESRLRAWLSL